MEGGIIVFNGATQIVYRDLGIQFFPDLSFQCEVVSGELVLKEAEAARWLTKKELDSVPWLPADRILLEKLCS